MTTYGASRFLQDKGTGAEEAIALKVFSGEVLTAFERFSITNGRVRTRSITSGKSAQFPLVGAMSSSMHTPGQNIILEGGASPTYLSQPKSSEKVIAIDGILQCSTLIPKIDEAMSHYDIRAPYGREMAWSLAKQFDIHTLQTIIVGAQTSATLSGDASDWGSTTDRTVYDADFDSGTAANTMTTIAGIVEAMDDDDVPEHGRHMAVSNTVYYKLAKDDSVVSADYNQNTRGDRGTGGDGTLQYLGMLIHKTNRIKDIVALGSSTYAQHAEELGTDYESDHFNHTLAVAWQEDWAVGVVKLMDLGLDTQWKLEYFATLIAGGFSVGHGVLHESACYVVRDADV
ncbi:MAG: hypothetical protein GY701_28750 [Sulfitobacter sp.]|nr:hypothetical protein [Sulfitobacter sp.]